MDTNNPYLSRADELVDRPELNEHGGQTFHHPGLLYPPDRIDQTLKQSSQEQISSTSSETNHKLCAAPSITNEISLREQRSRVHTSNPIGSDRGARKKSGAKHQQKSNPGSQERSKKNIQIERQDSLLRRYFYEGVKVECPLQSEECLSQYNKHKGDGKMSKEEELIHIRKHLLKYHEKERKERANNSSQQAKQNIMNSICQEIEDRIEIRNLLLEMSNRLNVLLPRLRLFAPTDDILESPVPDHGKIPQKVELSTIQHYTNIARIIRDKGLMQKWIEICEAQRILASQGYSTTNEGMSEEVSQGVLECSERNAPDELISWLASQDISIARTKASSVPTTPRSSSPPLPPPLNKLCDDNFPEDPRVNRNGTWPGCNSAKNRYDKDWEALRDFASGMLREDVALNPS